MATTGDVQIIPTTIVQIDNGYGGMKRVKITADALNLHPLWTSCTPDIAASFEVGDDVSIELLTGKLKDGKQNVPWNYEYEITAIKDATELPVQTEMEIQPTRSNLWSEGAARGNAITAMSVALAGYLETHQQLPKPQWMIEYARLVHYGASDLLKRFSDVVTEEVEETDE